MTQTKLLVAVSCREAERILRELELGDDWMALGLGDPLLGYRFDKIVVCLPDEHQGGITEWVKDYVSHLSSKLRDTGRLICI